MPTEVTFSDLSETDILERADFIATVLEQASSSLNASRGSMLWELVVYPAAVGYVYINTPINTLRAYWNMASVAADPANADDDIVDLLLSNFNITRSAGTNATGQAEIVLTEAHSLIVAAGTVFTAGDLTFTNLVDQVVIVTEADRTADADRVLTNRGDGTYSFRVDISASEVGTAGNITYGTAFTVSPQLTYFSSASAAADLSGGSAADTNASVVERAAQGLTGNIMSSEVSAKAQLMTLVPSSTDASVIGAQSPELTRDQRSLFGVSNGGRADIFLRTQSAIEVAMVSKTSTVTDASAHTHSISLDRDDLAGGYNLVSIIAEGDAQSRSLDILTQTWGYDVSNLTVAPDIESAQEAAFSSYQTLTVTFTDTADTGTYEVRFRRLPSISTAQTYCLNPDYRDPLADWLVRAPVPAMTSIEMTVKYPSGTTVDTTAVKSAIVNAVNANSFVSELSASAIIDAAAEAIPDGAYISMPMGMQAEIIYPDRVSHWIRSGNTLTTPTVNALCVSKNTVAFFASSDDIDVTTEVIT